MKEVRVIPLDHVVLEFLRAELLSPRFSKRYVDWLTTHGIAATIGLEQLTSEQRHQMLYETRPGICTSLPQDAVWHEVTLEQADWSRLMYMNSNPWIPFSHGTRLVVRSLDRLGQPVHEVLSKRVAEITEEITSGIELPKIILLTDQHHSKLVLIEGHIRATTYAAMGRFAVKVYLGMSEHAQQWAWW